MTLTLQRYDLATISGSILLWVVETCGKATAVPLGMNNLGGDSIWGSMVITGVRLFWNKDKHLVILFPEK